MTPAEQIQVLNRFTSEAGEEYVMSIVLPILFFVIVVSLNAKQMTPRVWAVIAVWIITVMYYNYYKN